MIDADIAGGQTYPMGCLFCLINMNQHSQQEDNYNLFRPMTLLLDDEMDRRFIHLKIPPINTQ